jgi:hypothetical protein
MVETAANRNACWNVTYVGNTEMTKKEMIKRKQALSYQIRNIRADYDGVLKEDIPAEVVEEVVALMAELKTLREELGNE